VRSTFINFVKLILFLCNKKGEKIKKKNKEEKIKKKEKEKRKRCLPTDVVVMNPI
jgi:hypothetical protein